jgi:hypothetical protein
VALPGLLTWLASAALLRRAGPGRARRLAADAAGLLAGGLLMAALWQGWLLAGGTWGAYWHNYAEFRADYYSTRLPWSLAAPALFVKVLPWGLLHVFAVPVALGALARAALERRPPAAPDQAAEPLLAGLYLGWLLQANFLQSQYDYHLVPTALLALTLLFGWLRARPAWGRLLLAGFVAVAVAWQPALRPGRLALWGRCWREGSTPDLKDRLALVARGPSWAELERVAGYLREQGLSDGGLLCYEATTLPVGLELGLRPPTRFLQPDTWLRMFTTHRAAIREELKAGPERFIVTDMRALELGLSPTQAAAERPGDPLALPPDIPPGMTSLWPYSEPVVFRAGRYYVHRVRVPRPAQP